MSQARSCDSLVRGAAMDGGHTDTLRRRLAALALLIAIVSVPVACGESTVPQDCETTKPNGMTPPGEEAVPTHHGNGSLYTALAPDGVVRAEPDGDSTLATKFPWWRAPGVGAAGDLKITGRELSTDQAVSAIVPAGYGQRFQASGIIFPSEGCYELTAQSGAAQLTVVVRVVAK